MELALHMITEAPTQMIGMVVKHIQLEYGIGGLAVTDSTEKRVKLPIREMVAHETNSTWVVGGVVVTDSTDLMWQKFC